jgi:hypothetical protein
MNIYLSLLFFSLKVCRMKTPGFVCHLPSSHLPSSVCRSEDGSIEIFWDSKLLVGKGIEANKPDLVIVDKVNQKWTFIDFCAPYL